MIFDHGGDSDVSWVKITEEDVASGPLQFDPPTSQTTTWHCAYCRDTPYDIGPVTITRLKIHFRLWSVHSPFIINFADG